ncbi:MAG: Mu transposase C-terminal domain-containing protein [Xenococcus sp. (in: cyanobacteria)]
MKPKIYVNELLEWKNTQDNPLIERVLWIDPSRKIAYVFDINATKGFPHLRHIEDIQDALLHEEVIKVEQEPWVRTYQVQDENLSEKEKSIRDKAWEIVEPLVSQEPEIYLREYRGGLVRDRLEAYNKADENNKLIEKTLYQYLRKFWQRGQTPNALLPDYINSGGKGKRKKSNSKKRGRPRKNRQDPRVGEGMNITERDLKYFRVGIRRFYNKPKKNSLYHAFKETIRAFYTEETEIEDGVMVRVLIPPDQRPTFAQFKYWYQTEEGSQLKSLEARKGTTRFSRENRGLIGTAKQDTIGPGYRFEIDATIGDVYLVSKYNRNWIIGRPVIYIVIDVFSRLITGLYVGLQGPSWIGAMMALSNTASNKVQFCQKYGITIDEAEWPCQSLPKRLLADGGELAGYKGQTMISGLGVHLENAAPYRADWKGLVEQHFDILQGQAKPFLPGGIDKDFRQRGGKDYRLDAKMNIDEFTEFLIEIVLHRNKSLLNTYQRDKEMIKDNIPAIPVKLWRWGLERDDIQEKRIPEDLVKLNLMPRDTARITERGIKFKQMFYTCEKAIAENWAGQARSKLLSVSERRLDISYDPRNTNYIYIRASDGQSYEKCYLLDPDDRYSNMNLDDVEFLLEQEKYEARLEADSKLQSDISLNGTLDLSEN